MHVDISTLYMPMSMPMAMSMATLVLVYVLSCHAELMLSHVRHVQLYSIQLYSV